MDHPFHLIEAIGLALQNSPVVRVQAGTSVAASDVTFFDIQAREAEIIEELAAFDTTFESSVGNNRFKNPPDSFFGPGLAQPSERDEWYLNFGWRKKLVWGGTTSASFNPNPNYLFIPDQPPGSFSPRHVAEWEFSVVQPLLRGAGRTFNLAPLEISQLSADQSAWDFKDEVMTSVREIVAAYWDLYAAGVALDAIELIIPLVEEIVRIQREAHKAEWVTITEVAKAEAQMYEFRRERETRRSEVLAAELRLRDLIGLPPEDGMKLIPITKPLEQHIAFSPQAVMLDALDNQPDLARRRIDIQVRSVEKEVALNGQKLQLDAIAVSRRNGVGESVDDAVRQMLTADFYDWELGLKLTVPLGRRQAAAAVRASEQLLAKEKVLFDQQILTTRHDLQDNLRSIEFAYRQYSEATQQLAAAERWVEGRQAALSKPKYRGRCLQCLGDEPERVSQLAAISHVRGNR